MRETSSAGSQRADSTPAVLPPESSKWLVLASVGAGTFMAALDGSVVNTTLPLITRFFHTDLASAEWVVTVYLLVLSGLLLSFGRLGDLRGHKGVYIAGFVVFMVSSLLCGLAISIPMLIIFRGVQALGAAMLASNSPAILTKSFPARQRGQALGLQATMTYLGLTVGPSLGGWLADLFSWRSIFYINIPVSIIAIYLSLRYISSEKPAEHRQPFDLAGAALFMAGLTALLFGLNQGAALGWVSPVILLSLLAAVILLAIFIFVELRRPAPMLDLSLFKNAIFSGATLSAVLNYICIYILIFLMPFYLNRGREFSLTQTGLLLTAMPFVMAVVAPLSGALSDRIGTRWPTVAGMLFLAIGLYLLSGLGPDSSPAQIALRLAVTGLGTGIFISPNTSALLGAAPRSRQGIASGILATARNFGMVLGVGLAGATFNTALSAFGDSQSPLAFASAIRPSFLVASGIALLGLVVTLWRGRQSNPA